MQHYSFDEDRDTEIKEINFNEDENRTEVENVAAEVDDTHFRIPKIDSELIKACYRLIEQTGEMPKIAGWESIVEITQMGDWERTKKHLEGVYHAIKKGLGDVASNRFNLGISRPHKTSVEKFQKEQNEITVEEKNIKEVIRRLGVEMAQLHDQLFQLELQGQYDPSDENEGALKIIAGKVKALTKLLEDKQTTLDKIIVEKKRIIRRLDQINAIHGVVSNDLSVELPFDSVKHTRLAAKMIATMAKSMWWSYLSAEQKVEQLSGRLNQSNTDLFDIRMEDGYHTFGVDKNQELLDTQEEMDACYQALLVYKAAYDSIEPPERARYWPEWTTEAKARSDFKASAERRAMEAYASARGTQARAVRDQMDRKSKIAEILNRS